MKRARVVDDDIKGETKKKKQRVVIPQWLTGSGVAPSALDKLMTWMGKGNIAFVKDDDLVGGSCVTAHAHPIRPHVYIDNWGDIKIICAECASECECCEELAPDLHPVDDGNSPHDKVCEKCLNNGCNCGDDSDHWPAFCKTCNRGCRELRIATLSDGRRKAVCDRCGE